MVDDIVNLLKNIDGNGTYYCDIGERVYKGRFSFDDDDTYPLLTVQEVSESNDNPDSPILQKVKINKRISVHGLADISDMNNPNDTAHGLISDIKKAIFSGDPRLNGDCISVKYIGSSISAKEDSVTKVSCTVDLAVVYAENLLNPND